MRSRLLPRLVPVALLALASVACTESTGDDADAAFELGTTPAFVNRVIPGHRPLALVLVSGAADGTVLLSGTASLTGATITFEPEAVRVGEVAEVWVDLPEVTTDTEVTVTVEGTRGKVRADTAFTFTAVPGSDDLADTAKEIAAVFLDRLDGTVPGIPASTDQLVNGTPVAGLLVVSHYAWFTDEAEIGLAWHIMVAPDDFAELSVRPRGAPAPTRVYRVGSWSTALAGGETEFTELEPPFEVVR